MTSEDTECSDREVIEDSYNLSDARDELVEILDGILELESDYNSSDDGQEVVESVGGELNLDDENSSGNDERNPVEPQASGTESEENSGTRELETSSNHDISTAQGDENVSRSDDSDNPNHNENHPEEMEAIQGHDLFCPQHLVRFWDESMQDTHVQHMHPTVGPPSYDSLPMFAPQHALNCISQHDFDLSGYDFKCYRNLMQCVQARVHNLLSESIRTRRGVKASIRTYIEFERIVPSEYLDNIIFAWFTFLDGVSGSNGVMKILLDPSAIRQFVEDTITSVEERVAIFVKATSGLRVRRVVNLNITLIDFKPIGGGTYTETPWLLSSYKNQHIINVDNSEAAAANSTTKQFDIKACFFWSVLAAKRVANRVRDGGNYDNRANRRDRQTTMATYRRFFEGAINGSNQFKLPMTLDQIPKFERLNPQYRVTVLGFDSKYDIEADRFKKLRISTPEKRKRALKMIKSCTYPLYVSKNSNPEAYDIPLLLLENEGYGHYIAIKDIDKFLADDGGYKKYHCQYCLQTFCKEENRDMHQRFCATIGLQVPILPEGEDAQLKFRDYKKMIPAPYKIFCDFEAKLVDINSPYRAEKLGKVPNHHEYVFKETLTGGKTKYLQKHVMIGYAYVCLNSQNEIQCHKAYLAADDNEDVALTFLEDIKELAKMLRTKLREKQKIAHRYMYNAPVEINDAVISHQGDCYFCSEPLLLRSELQRPGPHDPDFQEKFSTWKEMRTVRHHSHETFEFISLAHNSCNLRAGVNLDIPVYFHNLGGYDGHAIIKALSNCDGKIEIIPSTGEKYMAIMWNNIIKEEVVKFNPKTGTQTKQEVEVDGSWYLTFYDSYKFLNSSLDAQAKILAKIGPNAFPTTKTVFESLYPNAGDSIRLLYAKQVFPYNFIKSIEDLNYSGLPPKEAFYDNLRDEPIADEQYEFARLVWETFDIQNMGDWTKLYNLADVTILADAFCKFEDIFQREFNLDPANFFSLPSSAWSANLKYSKIELALLTDNHMYQFVESAIRGGLSCGGDIRYAESNNPYCDGYDPQKEKQYVINVDANALYPWGLSGMLPVRNFQWVVPDELEKFTPEYINNFGELDRTGYFIEVDLHFAKEDHDRFNAFPPAPHRRVVDESEMSDYQKELRSKLNMTNASLKTPKLIADLTDRKFYVLHYMELKKYLELGVKLVKVHKALSFEQENWMYRFVELCTQKRAATSDPYESFFWKILINSCFGKSIESKRNRKRINVVTREGNALALAKKATISDIMIISEDMVLVTMKAIRVKLNSPIYTGVTCLGRAKERMYDFYYNCVQREYGHENVQLLGGDTDSLFLAIKCDDIYADMKKPEISNPWLDRSDYNPEDPVLGPDMYDATNKKVRGMFKDVTAQDGVITKFCYLKSKLYGYRTTQDYEEKKAKGIDTNFVKKNLSFNDYHRVLFNDDVTTATAKRFQSLQHSIYTVECTKTALTSFDNKRYYVNAVDSLAYGHYKITQPSV